MVNEKINNDKQMYPFAGGLHCPMQQIQGYTQSLLTLPLGDYLLRIALMVARVQGKTTTMKNHLLCWPF
jgi:hypothetical protein